MRLITKAEVRELLDKGDLIVSPVLEESQIGQCTMDLRLGTTFKVSRQIGQPSIDLGESNIDKFFDKTYSDFGQEFILYPNQLVLSNTFEFIKLPTNIMAYVLTRSSLNRLGVQISSVVQPGYVGTLSIELINKGQNAIKFRVGMRVVQLIFYDIGEGRISPYTSLEGSKYIGNVDPQLSNIKDDYDFNILKRMK